MVWFRGPLLTFLREVSGLARTICYMSVCYQMLTHPSLVSPQKEKWSECEIEAWLDQQLLDRGLISQYDNRRDGLLHVACV